MSLPEYTSQNTPIKCITKLEFCQLCCISKSTGSKLIKSGAVPFEKCREGLLHYYKIPISAVDKYLSARAVKGVLTVDQAKIMRSYYEQKLSNHPDVIESIDIQDVTGYGKEIIRNWIHSEKILGGVVRKRFKVAKDDLIDFLVSPYYQSIIRKSDVHKEDEKSIKSKYRKGAYTQCHAP